MFKEFIPKSYICLKKNYSLATFRKDLMAGITVGVISVPIAMAFAMASGVSPAQGLVTAIVAGFLISALGGSRVQVGGPTGAFVILIYDIVQRNGCEGLAIATLIGGVLLILFGLFRIGSWIKFVPYPLITGFTTGLAILIFSSSIRDFFGLPLDALSPRFVAKWIAYIHAFPSLHHPTLYLGAGTLALIICLRKFVPRLPWGIIGIVVATICSYWFHLPVETIQSKFGQISSQLPFPSLPSFHIPSDKLSEIVTDGIAIALLGGIESLLSAVIGDGMMGGRHKSNCELVGQGIANIGSVLFGGIPATGAVARTATNVKSGAQTPVAGMIHALTVLLLVVCFAPIVSQIPLAALAAVMIMVAWNMSELPHFISLLKAPIGDVAILLTAFLLTLFVDIITAIEFGMILSSFLFMKRMSQSVKTVQLTPGFKEDEDEEEERSLPSQTIPSEVEVYEIQGPFFFGAADILKDLMTELRSPPKVFILRLSQVSFIDASGQHALKEFLSRCKKEKTQLLLSEVQPPVKHTLQKMGFLKTLGPHHIFDSLDKALGSIHSPHT